MWLAEAPIDASMRISIGHVLGTQQERALERGPDLRKRLLPRLDSNQ